MRDARENHLVPPNLQGEDDAAYHDKCGHLSNLGCELVQICGKRKIVIGQGNTPDELFGVNSINVDPNYSGFLSIAQKQLYEILLQLQNNSDCTATTVAHLAEAQGLKCPLACEQRLENLQRLGAISGLGGIE